MARGAGGRGLRLFWACARVGSRSTPILRRGSMRWLFAVFLALAGGWSARWAHTELEDSDPRADSVVGTGLERISLTFTTDVQLSLSAVVLLEVATETEAPGSVLGYVNENRRDVLVLTLAQPPTAGRHVVRWTTAGPDGHAIRGEYGFDVVAGPPEPVAEQDPVQDPNPALSSGETGGGLVFLGIAEASSRFLLYAAMLGLLGASAFRLRVLTADACQPVPAIVIRRVRIITAVSATAWLVSAVPRLAFQTRSFFPEVDAGNLWVIATGGAWGFGWWLQLALGAVIVAALTRIGPPSSRAHERPGIAWRVIGGAALLLPWTAILSGHAWGESARTAAVASTYLHILAAGGWLGCLGCLVAVLPSFQRRAVPPLGSGSEHRDTVDLTAIVESFSRQARVVVIVLVLSGAVRTGVHIGALADLWTTPWGRALALKIGIVLGVLALGMYNWRVARPKVARDPQALSISSKIELFLGAVAVIATSFLVSQPLR